MKRSRTGAGASRERKPPDIDVALPGILSDDSH
jgi:hypothetical protein